MASAKSLKDESFRTWRIIGRFNATSVLRLSSRQVPPQGCPFMSHSKHVSPTMTWSLGHSFFPLRSTVKFPTPSLDVTQTADPFVGAL